MLLYYSDIGRPPNAPAIAQVLKSSKIKSTVSHSFLIWLDPNTLAFLYFQSVQQMSIMNVSNPFRICLCMHFLASVHHCTNRDSYVGQSSTLNPILVMQLYYTCLENTHCCKMWSTVSSSWSQKLHLGVWSCQPCQSLLSDVHN